MEHDYKTPEGWWVLRKDLHRTASVRATGRLDWDTKLMKYVTRFIKPGDVVVDAGASIGDHTIAYQRAVGPSGYVIAYEPREDAYKCLIRNCRGDNITCYQMGLGDRCTNMGMSQEGDDLGTSYLTEDEAGSIPVVALDKHRESWPDKDRERLDFMKIDIEGMEVLMLRGAREAIEKNHPVILIECYPELLARYKATANDIRVFLEGLGYNSFEVDQEDMSWVVGLCDILARVV
jgi:FkbM family methyltransferase